MSPVSVVHEMIHLIDPTHSARFVAPPQADVRTNRDLIPVVIDTIAAFDRRTSVGGKAAPAPGKPVATKAASAPVDGAEVRRLRARGFSPLRIAKKLKVVPASVYGALVGRPAP